ncbi:hypothetical protein C2G38_2222944 [Gigaspora rosea]|uniref:TLD-domain-containing protein n=1 Tax=Gigaspora rosea TaxID=44941 RepID=A0A397U1S3_9GLOM|nr:hypothetical protein C2G38_2222944 [Gigaspora rosea]
MSKFFEKLSNDCLELLDDKEDFNVIINVGESTNTKIFQTHSNILRYRSLYFRNELANIRKDKNNIKTINLNHVSIQQFEVIIKDLNKGYIYGGVVLLEKDQGASFIFELILVASEFLLDELVNHLETQLINENAHWLRLNFTNIYHKSFQNENLRELQKWSNDILAKYPEKIFESEEFATLPENALISLIKRDDLQMDEGKIWEHVIRWGIAQNKYLPSDPKDWSHENFLTLKTTLQNCLPFIRYFQMLNDDIVDKVKPYKNILEENLWDDILTRFLTPNRQILSTILPPRLKPTFDPLPSKVINENNAAEIASWIDKKTEMYSVKNNPYKFKMLLRGTRDGFTLQSFWNLCDKQSNTVVVIKVNGTDEILGGYNPIQWDKSVGWSRCNGCFIFSLKNGAIQSSILSRVKPSYDAIYCHYSYGPTFGGGHDLYMGDNSNQNNNSYCYHNTYEKAIRNQSGQSFFCVEEYEIFQIQKKKISNEQILSTILPPRKILTPTFSSRGIEPFPSEVINEDHAAEIASWIDNRVNGTDKILGRYNPIQWDKLVDPQDLILCDSNDLHMGDNFKQNNNCNMKNQDGTFYIEEYESISNSEKVNI